MEGHGIDTRMVWTGNVLRQPASVHRRTVSPTGGLPNADRVMEWGVILPNNHGLTDDDVDYIVETVDAFLTQAVAEDPRMRQHVTSRTASSRRERGPARDHLRGPPDRPRPPLTPGLNAVGQSASASAIFWVVSIHSSTMS